MVLHLSLFYCLQFSDCIPGCSVNGFTSEEREKEHFKYEYILIVCCSILFFVKEIILNFFVTSFEKTKQDVGSY